MVVISGGFRAWMKKRIRIRSQNTFVGDHSGWKTTGDNNCFLGYLTGYNNIGGDDNTFIGSPCGYYNTTGYSNVFLGYFAGCGNIGGYRNTFLGVKSGHKNTSGKKNNFWGYEAGYNNLTGDFNCFIGYTSGYTNTGGDDNIFLGSYSGFFETGSDRLFIDNRTRADEADGRIKALIYGIYADATANQLIRLNAILELTTIKSGATQAGAGAAVNEVWKTASHATLSDNVLMLGV